MSIIYENITLDLDKITDEYARRIAAATDELMDEKLASIGYVKVVRCRDCKYRHTVRSWLGMDVEECWLHADHESGALGKEPTEPDGFCAWGERRDA